MHYTRSLNEVTASALSIRGLSGALADVWYRLWGYDHYVFQHTIDAITYYMNAEPYCNVGFWEWLATLTTRMYEERCYEREVIERVLQCYVNLVLDEKVIELPVERPPSWAEVDAAAKAVAPCSGVVYGLTFNILVELYRRTVQRDEVPSTAVLQPRTAAMHAGARTTPEPFKATFGDTGIGVGDVLSAIKWVIIIGGAGAAAYYGWKLYESIADG